MTDKEQKAVDQLLTLVRQLREENAKFRDDVERTVLTLNAKTEKKHLPVTLEQDILHAAVNGVSLAIKSIFTDNYKNPLRDLTNVVVEEHKAELKAIINECFETTIRSEDFKSSILSAFSHKIARTIISNNDGMFDKVSNELKSDAIFKSRMTLAVSTVVDECLKERKA